MSATNSTMEFYHEHVMLENVNTVTNVNIFEKLKELFKNFGGTKKANKWRGYTKQKRKKK